jgi:hypothetical protein
MIAPPPQGGFTAMFSPRKGMLALSLLVCAFVMLSFLSPRIAAAAGPSGPKYSFLVVQHGKITHSWSGVQSNTAQFQKDLQAMSLLQHSLLLVSPTASTIGKISSFAMFPAIQPEPCGQGQYFQLEDDDYNFWCYAYQGTATVNLYDIIEIYTGNNEGNFTYDYNGGDFHYPGNGDQICKYEYVDPSIIGAGAFQEIYTISITNPNDPCQ